MTDFSRYVTISKVDDDQRMVWGYASTPALDYDNERVSLEAMKSALPDYMAWGNIREMHGNSAVGVAQEAEITDLGLWIGAHIVDDQAWRKVKTKVYKGFSIGGKVLKKTGDVIEEILLAEISLVDRPANPECRIDLFKRAGASDSTIAELVHVAKREDVSVAADVVTGEEIGLLGRLMAKMGLTMNKSILGGPVSAVKPELGTTPLDPHQSHDIDRDGEVEDQPDGDEEKFFGKEADDGTDSKKPYGDVEYADPGHQADGKKRYPIDTEEHIRAAWNYIHKPRNSKKYSSEQVASIKSKIESAWKDKIDSKGPPSASKMVEVEDEHTAVEKSMYEVIRLGEAFLGLSGTSDMLSYEERDENGDVVDGSMSQEAAGIGVQISALIARIATHEGGELAARSNKSAGGTMPTEIEKRRAVAAARVESAKKAVRAIGNASKCTGTMMECIKSLHDMHMDHARTAKAAAAEKKIAPAFDHAKAMTIVHKMFGAGTEQVDHHELATHHVSKAVGQRMGPGDSDPNWQAPPGITDLDLGSLTEGEVPEYTADEPYAGKGAFTQEQVDMLVKAASETAFLKGKVEALERLPAQATGPRGRTFDIGKSIAGMPGSATESTDPRALLLDGVTMPQEGDQGGAQRSAAKMIGNMIKNAGVFGRDPNNDPTFHGAAG